MMTLSKAPTNPQNGKQGLEQEGIQINPQQENVMFVA